MIKLTVHESVEAALQKAFPKPAATAKRALAKYISVVESMLFDALQRGQTPSPRTNKHLITPAAHKAKQGYWCNSEAELCQGDLLRMCPR